MPVELLRHHAPDQQAQLVVATGLGQRGAPQVVAEVEVRIVEPDGASQRQRQEMDPLAVEGTSGSFERT